MSDANDRLELRVLVLAPTKKDAELTGSILKRSGIESFACRDVAEICAQLVAGAAAILLPEEAITQDTDRCLAAWLAEQPPWSDLPVLVLARTSADSAYVAQTLNALGDVVLLERPLRIAALVSAVRTALRARQRQYQIRDYLVERDREIQAQSLLAAIVASSADAIVSKSLTGTIRTWNAGAERLFGYRAEEVIGKSIAILIPPDRLNEEAAILDRVSRGQRVEHFETVRIAKDGREIDVALTISPVRDSQGTIVGASKVARDITQRKETEAALREADRRKNEFLAILAHELRNPLAPIKNSLHILRMSAGNDPSTDSASEIMERQVDHMVRLVDDLMEISRITRGNIELRKAHVELATIVRGAVETSRPYIDGAGHQLALAIPPEPLILDADAVRLTQVIANLLNNAAKYTDPGGQIWLTVKREAQSVAISVRDTGTGIPADMLPRVFDLFTQVDRSFDRAQGGLGIGLALVKSLVEMHGGSVQARSDGPGKGSEFVIRLPIAASIPRVGTSSHAPRRSAALASSRILVVDDNRDAAKSLSILLRLLGADVYVAYNGPDALKELDRHRPNAVLLDIGMPDMDGHEVARQIRLRPEFRDVTLIALTGWGQEEDRRLSKSAGFNFHLVKPVDAGALQTILVPQHSGERHRLIQPVESP